MADPNRDKDTKKVPDDQLTLARMLPDILADAGNARPVAASSHPDFLQQCITGFLSGLGEIEDDFDHLEAILEEEMKNNASEAATKPKQ